MISVLDWLELEGQSCIRPADCEWFGLEHEGANVKQTNLKWN